MRESIANSFIFTIIITFVIVIMLLVVSSLNYSKAFKAKNRVIDIIEKYDTGWEGNKTAITSEVNTILQQMGYRRNTDNQKCPTYQTSANGTVYTSLSDTTNYLYCIYEIPNSRGKVYHVMTYLFWEMPGFTAKAKIEGDTIVFYQTIDTFRPN